MLKRVWCARQSLLVAVLMGLGSCGPLLLWVLLFVYVYVNMFLLLLLT